MDLQNKYKTIKTLEWIEFILNPIIIVFLFIMCSYAVYQDNEYNYTWAGNMKFAYIICVGCASIVTFLSYGLQKHIDSLIKESSMQQF
jgi:amino acid permease